MESLWEGYPSVIEQPIAWGDMDAYQHVNNSVYLRYAETGRIEYFRPFQFDNPFLPGGSPIGPILAEINCRYKAPLTFPDTISIASRVLVETIEEDSLRMSQLIISHRLKRVAAELKARIVSYDYQKFQKTPFPEEIVLKIKEIEG